ncbi:MAG: 2-oxoacid:ferredoxin oxidoreductase subunit beta [Candidatus Zixiibacteriota bacterium]
MATTATPPEAPQKLTRKDFVSDQEVRWCPGCGDYSILAQMQKTLPDLGIPKEKIVFVSGIGCSSRFPYYMNTYGFHSIHGRATAIATGIKAANPDLMVWVVTGDGDGLSIGGNHMLHVLRRNVDLKIILFNNRIYGLTKGQTSPTSELGKVTKSTPMGSIEHPIEPVSFALASGATFVARAIDSDTHHLQHVIHRAAEHRGAAFVEVFQNCNIFNDGAFENVAGKDVRDEMLIRLEHGKPIVFGKDRDKGLCLNGYQLEIVRIGDGVSESDLLVHNENLPDSTLAYLLAHQRGPGSPVPVGVFRAVKQPTYDELLTQQIETAREKKGPGSLRDLIYAGLRWTVTEDGGRDDNGKK